MSGPSLELPTLPLPRGLPQEPNQDERAALVRRAKLLAWVGLGWHGVEATIAILAGLAASSIALIGFGADSLIESLAGLVVIWRFAAARSLSEGAELALAKARIGERLGSAATRSEGRQNLVCAYLSAGLLLGLGSNAAFGWWWADPLAALLIAAVAVKEGREAWAGEGCCVAAPELGDACQDDCCV